MSIRKDTSVVGGHQYVLVGYDASTDQYSLYNPWGGPGSTITQTGSQLASNFAGYTRAV